MSESIPTYVIVHHVHGEAHCDDRMIAEFEAAGWKRKPEPKDKAKPTKNSDAG